MNRLTLRDATLRLPFFDRLLLLFDIARSLVGLAGKRRSAVMLSPEESRLLLAINRGLPEEVHARYQVLQEQRDRGELNSATHAELLALGDRVEALEAERLTNLVELAQLRRISLGQLMVDLGLPAPRSIIG
jgi:hypothetical protein